MNDTWKSAKRIETARNHDPLLQKFSTAIDVGSYRHPSKSCLPPEKGTPGSPGSPHSRIIKKDVNGNPRPRFRNVLYISPFHLPAGNSDRGIRHRGGNNAHKGFSNVRVSGFTSLF
jgi:hypothetical protein